MPIAPLETRFCWDGCKRNTVPYMTVTGVRVCTYCGEKFPAEFPVAEPSSVNETRINYLQHRIKALEEARELDAMTSTIRSERTAAWMNLPAIEARIKALEDKASYYHHIPVGDPSVGSLFERMADLEAWRGRQTKGRRL